MPADPFAALTPAPRAVPVVSPLIEQFQVYEVAYLMSSFPARAPLAFDRRSFYKISLVRGSSRVEYADQVLEVAGPTLWFANPQVPYRWQPRDADQTGYLCAFTEEFLLPAPGRAQLAGLPLFQPGACPVRAVSEAQYAALADIFQKMQREAASSYAYRAELLRAYLLELIYYGQQLFPTTVAPPNSSAASRLAAQFTALLEQQFPRLVPGPLPLRTARDYAAALAVHVNHLNRVLKQEIGQPTTTLLTQRLAQEAQLLLRQSDWTIAAIADSLGFADTSHFCRFFRRLCHVAPGDYRAAHAV